MSELLGQCGRDRVFVSHASADVDYIRREIVDLLRSRQIDAWFSVDGIPSADHWERTILKALTECGWFLLVMSPHSAKSEWVKDELHWALEHRRGRIVPVMIDDCEPNDFHIRLNRIQFVDFRRDVPKAKAELLRLLQQTSQATPIADARPATTSRGRYLVAGLAALLLVVGGYLSYSRGLTTGETKEGAAPSPTGAAPAPKTAQIPPTKLEPFVITACSAGHYAFESEPDRSGLFTACLPSLLRGDGDGNADGLLTNVELFDYLRRKVPVEATKQQRQQTPDLVRGSLATAFDLNPAPGGGAALVVGVADYERMDDLRFSANDADATAEELIRFGFAPDRVVRLNDRTGEQSPADAPTRRNVLDRLIETAAAAKPEDVVVFYFSGTGGRTDDGTYLATADAEEGRPDTMLALDDVCRILENCPARRSLVICDSCRIDLTKPPQ